MPSTSAVLVFLNGRFVSEELAVVSVFDRGFLYGDGIFETLLVVGGKPFRWDQHWQRFEKGAGFLQIRCPLPSEVLRDSVNRLVAENQMPDSLLRLTLSRGQGIRGYSPKGAARPTLVMTLHPAPVVPERLAGWHLISSTVRLPANEPLSQFKTCNKLPQIIARAEADALEADEALLLNTDGCVVEGSSSNLFWLERELVCTPALTAGVLPGVTRSIIFEICRAMGLTVRESNPLLADLHCKSAVFVSLSSVGIAEALSLNGKSLPRSPLVSAINQHYWRLVQTETA